jgi:ubiquitin C-terminal hydrolase
MKDNQIGCKHEFQHNEIFGGYSIWKCRRCGKLQKCREGDSPPEHLIAKPNAQL